MIQIADRLVDYNENFRLYLFSGNADLTLSSDQSVLLTIVNFTLNHIGLTEQVERGGGGGPLYTRDAFTVPLL